MARALPAVAVATLLLTAGCAGLFGGEAVPDRDAFEVPPATPTVTPTAAVDGLQGGPAGQRVPSLRDRGGQRDLPAVLEAHQWRVRAAGSVTVRRVETVTSQGRTTRRAFTYRIDFDDERYWSRLERGGEAGTTITVYATGDAAYRRTNRSGEVHYRTVRDPGTGNLTVGDLPVRTIQELFVNRGLVRALEPNGTTTFRGIRVRRYTAHTLPAETRRSFQSVTTFELTVLVDDGGIVRAFEYTLRGRTAAGERYFEHSKLTVSAVGNTTVSRPGWAGNATR